MHFVKLLYDGRHYRYDGSSALKMDILGRFFISDVRESSLSYRNWALSDPNLSACGNVTSLDKEDGNICLSDLYSEESVPAELEMTLAQFVQLLDDWEKKVCKAKPTEVIIKHENDQFIVETKN